MTPLTLLAIDDEPLALRRLAVILREIPGVRQVGEAAGCEEALRRIEVLKPDVLLLDIQMRDGSGFDLIDRLPAGLAPAVIFVTAFDHYAARAFDACAVDYVLKPISAERLCEAITRVRERRAANNAEQQIAELHALVAKLRGSFRPDPVSHYESELWIRKSSGGFVRVALGDVDYVTSEEDYIRVHTRRGSYLMRGSIRNLEARVDPATFVRIHRRALVRIDAVREFRSTRLGSLELLLISGETLAAGRVYGKHLRALVAAASRATGTSARQPDRE